MFHDVKKKINRKSEENIEKTFNHQYSCAKCPDQWPPPHCIPHNGIDFSIPYKGIWHILYL